VDAYSSSLRLPGLPSKATEEQPSARTVVESELATDEHLMSRLHQGDQEAIAAPFKRHSSAIHRVGKKMLQDSGEADDLVQEVFLYVYRRSELFDPSKGPARFLDISGSIHAGALATEETEVHWPIQLRNRR
jgi:RNA polymerase sigma-70 factor (ECF subfamily)